MKRWTLEKTILNNYPQNSDVKIGIDGRYSRIIKESITIKELFEGRNKTLLNRTVKEILKGSNDNTHIFVLNIK